MTDAQDEIRRHPLYEFLGPRYWGIWIVIGIMRAGCWLPYPIQMKLGRGIGRLLYRLAGKRRLIARRNIELCFPDLDKAEQAAMTREHFESLGACLMEMALGWWGSDRQHERLMRVEGIEHLHEALEHGNGAILLTAHFTSIEASGRLFKTMSPPFKAMFRPGKNPLFNEMLRRGREKSAYGVIAKDDVRTMLKTLKRNMPVLYAPDQSYGMKWSALVPFFGVPAMSNVATSRISRMTGAPVLPYLPLRLPDDGGYVLSILPPIDGFPSDDPSADTLRYHQVLEEHILKDPSQYWWVHRRFKNRPEPLPDAYGDL